MGDFNVCRSDRCILSEMIFGVVSLSMKIKEEFKLRQDTRFDLAGEYILDLVLQGMLMLLVLNQSAC